MQCDICWSHDVEFKRSRKKIFANDPNMPYYIREYENYLATKDVIKPDVKPHWGIVYKSL